MDKIFSQVVSIQEQECNEKGVIKLSGLLHQAQEISGKHCEALGYGWNIMLSKGIFWAVLRHKIYIERLPVAGESIRLETWPMPTTRSAYPRAVRAWDAQGRILFEVISLWVIMDAQTRNMILPGKSGVEIAGILRGDEKPAPGSLTPGNHEHTKSWQVTEQDLDRNGHVNNGKYLDHVEGLTENSDPREATVCYLAEALLGQEITLNWTVSSDAGLTLDGYRIRTDVLAKKERVFGVKIVW